jgi:hypothetical protein
MPGVPGKPVNGEDRRSLPTGRAEGCLNALESRQAYNCGRSALAWRSMEKLEAEWKQS